MELSRIYQDIENAGGRVYIYNIGFAPALTLGEKADLSHLGVSVDAEQIESIADLSCKLAHECGHCATGALHEITSSFDLVARHENKAWRWAIERYLPYNEIREAVRQGYSERWELAEWFGLPEHFIERALEYYTECRGIYAQKTKK